jgi:hypothetical protein
MTTKKSEEETKAPTSDKQDGSPKDEGPKKGKKPSEQAKAQAKAAQDAYLEAQKEKRNARLQAAGLAEAPAAEGATIEVRTVPGPGGMPRKSEAGGMIVFGPKPKTVALGAITYAQYHSIMSNPLLEVKGKAPKDFDGWAKG